MKAYFLSAALISAIICFATVMNKPTGKFSPEYHSMENATKLTVSVDDIDNSVGDFIRLKTVVGCPVVEVDTIIDIEELLYVKEEIVVRVAENNRVSIIAGDNGDF